MCNASGNIVETRKNQRLDLNGDGVSDRVIFSQANNTVTQCFGNPQGGWSNVVQNSGMANTISIAGKFDGDSKDDFLTSSASVGASAPTSVWIHHSNGVGGAQGAVETFTVGNGTMRFKVGHFNNAFLSTSDWDDVIGYNPENGEWLVALNNHVLGSGMWSIASSGVLAAHAQIFVCPDRNNDGLDDIVIDGTSSPPPYTLLWATGYSNGAGGFILSGLQNPPVNNSGCW
jgi:hypothetical protein